LPAGVAIGEGRAMEEVPVRPAALERVVAQARAAAAADPSMPRERPVEMRRLIKLAYQAELHDARERAGAMGLVWFGVILAGAILGPLWLMRGPRWLGALACGAVAVAVVVFHRRGQGIHQAREARLAGSLGTTPFPVDGLIDFLTADRPLAEVHLRAAVAPGLLEDAVRTVDGEAVVTWLSPRRARLALTPAVLRPVRHKHPAVLGGDLTALRGLIERVLAPLHLEVPLDRLDLGGEVTTDRR
jgi:hypothetical protein